MAFSSGIVLSEKKLFRNESFLYKDTPPKVPIYDEVFVTDLHHFCNYMCSWWIREADGFIDHHWFLFTFYFGKNITYFIFFHRGIFMIWY